MRAGDVPQEATNGKQGGEGSKKRGGAEAARGKFRGERAPRPATSLVNSIFKTGSEQCPLYTSPPARWVHFVYIYRRGVSEIRDLSPSGENWTINDFAVGIIAN